MRDSEHRVPRQTTDSTNEYGALRDPARMNTRAVVGRLRGHLVGWAVCSAAGMLESKIQLRVVDANARTAANR